MRKNSTIRRKSELKKITRFISDDLYAGNIVIIGWRKISLEIETKKADQKILWKIPKLDEWRTDVSLYTKTKTENKQNCNEKKFQVH